MRSKVDMEKYLVHVVLVDPQVAFRHLERGMVENIHQYGGLHAHFPCVVAKGFPQGVAADFCF